MEELKEKSWDNLIPKIDHVYNFGEWSKMILT